MKNLFLLLATAFLFTLSSGCVKNVINPDACNFAIFNDEVNPQLMAYQEALMTYNDDPTPENCNEFKSKGQAWLDAVGSYSDCSIIYTQSLRDAVEEAKAELAAEPCD